MESNGTYIATTSKSTGKQKINYEQICLTYPVVESHIRIVTISLMSQSKAWTSLKISHRILKRSLKICS